MGQAGVDLQGVERLVAIHHQLPAAPPRLQSLEEKGS